MRPTKHPLRVVPFAVTMCVALLIPAASAWAAPPRLTVGLGRAEIRRLAEKTARESKTRPGPVTACTVVGSSTVDCVASLISGSVTCTLDGQAFFVRAGQGWDIAAKWLSKARCHKGAQHGRAISLTKAKEAITNYVRAVEVNAGAETAFFQDCHYAAGDTEVNCQALVYFSSSPEGCSEEVQAYLSGTAIKVRAISQPVCPDGGTFDLAP